MSACFISRAEKVGREHGVNAAGWWFQESPFGGRNRTGTAESIAWGENMLAKIDECEADLPQSDMSGEWADGYTPQRLADDIGYDAERDKREAFGFLYSDLCDAYEWAFAEACEREIVKTLRAHVRNAKRNLRESAK